MKPKRKQKLTTSQTEMKLRFGVGLTRHLISGVLCSAVISLICARASAQNLFVSDFDYQGNYGIISEFTPNGVRSTFASGLISPAGLAFDKSGNLFVADAGSSAVYKFTPDGVRSTFASGLPLTGPVGLVFDSAGNLFVAADVTIYKFTPTGARTTFATVQLGANGLAFDRAGNLFVAAGYFALLQPNTGFIYEFSPTGVRTTFSSGLNYPFALAFDSGGNLFVADGGYDGYDFPVLGAAVYKFTPSGLRSTVASETDQVSVIPYGLAIDSADNLFVADQVSHNILKFTSGGVRSVFVPGGGGYGLAFQPIQTSSAGQLQNISTRAFAQTGDDVMIGGFIITGSGQKKVILRAIGPSLINQGITQPMQDPTLELHDHAGALVASNDNWMDAPNEQEIIDSGLAPTNNLESAILMSLNPGSYTAIVRGVNNGTGIALVEGYDLDSSAGSKFGNISTRAFVQTGDNVMIGGLIMVGSGTVIVRAIGPSLAQQAITNPLADPMLELHDSNGTLFDSNDNWKDAQQAQIQTTGLAPTNDAESAIMQTLAPGNYTAIVRGKNDMMGVAVIEVYGVN